jgi:hypothetical protein
MRFPSEQRDVDPNQAFLYEDQGFPDCLTPTPG